MHLRCALKKTEPVWFCAEVLVENKPMLRLFERWWFEIEKRNEKESTNAHDVQGERIRLRGRSKNNVAVEAMVECF